MISTKLHSFFMELYIYEILEILTSFLLQHIQLKMLLYITFPKQIYQKETSH